MSDVNFVTRFWIVAYNRYFCKASDASPDVTDRSEAVEIQFK